MCITACKDRKRVSLKKKLKGLNNGQHWTVKLERNCNGSLTGRFNLESIYGTFLGGRYVSSRWFGLVNIYKVRQTPKGEEDDGLSPPFYVQSCALGGNSETPLNWYDLRIKGPGCEFFLVPEEDMGLRLVESVPNHELWHFQVVGNKKGATLQNKEQQKPAPTPAPVPTPTPDPPSSGAKIPSHDSQPPMRPSVKQANKCVVINLNNLGGGDGGGGGGGGGDGRSSVYCTGHNTNESGQQKNGDICVRNEVGKCHNLNVQINLTD